MPNNQLVFTLPQKSLWVDIVDAAQQQDRARTRRSFERYVRKYPKLVGFGLLYGHLVVEDVLVETHPGIVTNTPLLTSVCQTISERLSPMSPLLTPERVDGIVRISLGLNEHEPADSNEMLLVLLVASAVVPESRAAIVAELGRIEEKVLDDFGDEEEAAANAAG